MDLTLIDLIGGAAIVIAVWLLAGKLYDFITERAPADPNDADPVLGAEAIPGGAVARHYDELPGGMAEPVVHRWGSFDWPTERVRLAARILIMHDAEVLARLRASLYSYLELCDLEPQAGPVARDLEYFLGLHNTPRGAIPAMESVVRMHGLDPHITGIDVDWVDGPTHRRQAFVRNTINFIDHELAARLHEGYDLGTRQTAPNA